MDMIIFPRLSRMAQLAARIALRMTTATTTTTGQHDAPCDGSDGYLCRCAGARVTVESGRAVGLADRASLVGPLVPFTAGAANDGADECWHALAPMVPTMGPWLFDILRRVAYGHGRTDVPMERLDDVRQDALVRAHAALVAVAADAAAYPVLSCDDHDDDDDDNACNCARVAGVVGWVVCRPRRCGACDSCALLPATVSRWSSLAKCGAPIVAADYVTPRRALGRALFGEAARALRSAKVANLRDGGAPDDVDAAAAADDALSLVPDMVATIVRATTAACELGGIGIAGTGQGHGRYGIDVRALSILAMTMGHAATPAGRRAALDALREAIRDADNARCATA